MKKYTVITSDGQAIKVPGIGFQIDPNTHALVILADLDSKRSTAAFARNHWLHVIAPKRTEKQVAPEWQKELARLGLVGAKCPCRNVRP